MLESMNVQERPVTRWGVNLSAAVFMDDAGRDAQLKRLTGIGVDVVRISIPWSWVETVQGKPNWTFIDKLMADLARHSIRPLVEVSNMPQWARPAGTPETFGPATAAQRAGYAKHCGAVAERYKGQIYAYEIWNEANGGTWYPKPNMDDYSQMFVEAYKAIKAADPQAPVITTGMAGNCGLIDALPWTRDFVKTPAMALADGLGFHPYSNGDGKVSGMLLDAAFVRQELDAAGFSHIPLYMTEVGISTGGVDCVTEEMQAKIVDVTADWLGTLHGVNCIMWYCDMDSVQKQASNWKDFEGYFGLFRKDGSAKPAVTNFANQLKKSLPAGVVPTDWFIHDGAEFVPLVHSTI